MPSKKKTASTAATVKTAPTKKQDSNPKSNRQKPRKRPVHIPINDRLDDGLALPEIVTLCGIRFPRKRAVGIATVKQQPAEYYPCEKCYYLKSIEDSFQIRH
ncbi:hypothetical protein [Corynebacterium gerontici]|uniref:Uncharacterized protein n=1 Tax=Corynebacterium gerontici TaxID=2079234 RepID=A0A3G6IZ73_9CORY|nr:hypothetical protein [Corynebacterium gerontici]AZA11091.1 hypothetical protein CGERO_03870 [Corynebacterium gerontici]